MSKAAQWDTCRTPNQMSNCHCEPLPFVFLCHNNVETLCVCHRGGNIIASPHLIEKCTTYWQKEDSLDAKKKSIYSAKSDKCEKL